MSGSTRSQRDVDLILFYVGIFIVAAAVYLAGKPAEPRDPELYDPISTTTEVVVVPQTDGPPVTTEVGP